MIARLRALHPTLIDLSTSRVERLLDRLGRPQDRMGPVIHVAGTNGKGSTTTLIRYMAEAAGLRVHVLTSPHLVRFAERIRIAGRLIDDAALAARIDEVEAANAGAPISFFEITTALAFHAFAREPADLCVIEVGLGGRFDATNVFPAPAVSVITPVDLDHLEMLGPDLARIAWEKAGILKAGRPAAVARQRPEAMEVIEAEAQALGAPLTVMGRDADAWAERGRLVVQLPDRLHDLPPPALAGVHQFANAGLAIAAIDLLADPRIDEEALAHGVAAARWPARMQRLDRGPLAAIVAETDLWLDGAHNPHAAIALAQACAALQARDGRPVALVCGMLGRKDAEGFFSAFTSLKPKVFVTGFSSPSATPPEDLAAAARRAGLDAAVVGGVIDGLAQAMASGSPPPHIVIAGSLHFAGDVLAMSQETWPD
ncbi:MAG TPA: folylpolyglutamate synthase/dihydrofolate synthase family protein [Caulobacteraceae bacterium]|nr:folylpolyglutamate synthase/dihydrofolate synthase family protein [Caulobacteraceae bacterium]